MVFKLQSSNEIEREVEVIDYSLCNGITINYNVILLLKHKKVKVLGAPISLDKEEFKDYKELPINEMLQKILNDYL